MVRDFLISPALSGGPEHVPGMPFDKVNLCINFFRSDAPNSGVHKNHKLQVTILETLFVHGITKAADFSELHIITKKLEKPIQGDLHVPGVMEKELASVGVEDWGCRARPKSLLPLLLASA